MIDKPLYQNPLGGGLSFRQEGDMGRYIADNDPGGIAAGFSNLQDFLAAGNKLPEQKTPNDLLGVSNANFNVSPPGTLKLDPQATLNMLGSNITAPGQIPDRYKEGFADFYNQNPDDYMRMGGQAISYVTTPQGETIRFGDTGGASNFRRYLESIGETPKDDLLPISTNLSTQPLQPGFDSQENPFIDDASMKGLPETNQPPMFTDTSDLPPPKQPPVSNMLPPSNTFIDDMRDKTLPGLHFPEGTGPLQTVQGPEDTLNPYNRVGKQLTGPDQFGDLNSRLNKIEQGIMSLLGNRGQNSSMNFNSPYNFNWGLSSFPPYGGMYG